MTPHWFELASKISQDTTAMTQEMGRISAKALETLFAQQKEALETYAASGQSLLEKLTKIKDVPGLISLQGETLSDCNSKVLENFKAVAHTLNESREELSTLGKSAMKTAEATIEMANESVKSAFESNQTKAA